MKRYAIEIVRGNEARLFGTYDTKEQGYEVGKSYSQALAGEGGVIVLFRGEFDEKNNRLTNESRIYQNRKKEKSNESRIHTSKYS